MGIIIIGTTIIATTPLGTEGLARLVLTAARPGWLT